MIEKRASCLIGILLEISELACKPDSVRDDHSSGSVVTDTLLRPTRNASREQRTHSCLVLLQTGFTMPRPLPARAVRSYRTFSPLPAPMARWRFIFCGTFHRLTAPGCYPALRSLESGLSSSSKDKATVQPTRWLLYGRK